MLYVGRTLMFDPRSHSHSRDVSLVSLFLFVFTLSFPFVSCVAPPVIDQAIYFGSTQLHSHIRRITNFTAQLYDKSDLSQNEANMAYEDPDITLVRDNIYLGGSCINITSDVNTTTTDAPPSTTTTHVTTCVPLQDVIATSIPTPTPAPTTGTDPPAVANLTYISFLTSLNITGLTSNLTTSSNPLISRALDQIITKKDPEIMIIQDHSLLPLYPVYRDSFLPPALHSLLSHAPELRHVFLLPSWADPDPNPLRTTGLSYDNHTHMQQEIDIAYNKMEHELNEWMEARGYPINITNVKNEIVTQQKPTLVTIPVGPVFEAIMSETNWTIPLWNITYKDGIFTDPKTDERWDVSSPYINIYNYSTVTGTQLIYENTTSTQLTTTGSYVLSLLLFSSIYRRFPINSTLPIIERVYDVIEYPKDDQPAPKEVENKTLYIPYITNQTATRIQQIVHTELFKRNITKDPYILPIVPSISSSGESGNSSTTSTSNSSSSSSSISSTGDSSSSSSISSSSSSTESSSSLSSTANVVPSTGSITSNPTSESSSSSSSSTATAITDGNNQGDGESPAQGIKGYWALIIGGIVGLSILLYCCYRKKQKHALRQGYGHMQFDMEKGYEVELQEH